MKRCPQCHRTYGDKKREFCLTDGTLLSIEYDPNVSSPRKKDPILEGKIRFPLELPRVYCLFGYERDGARESTLWNDPLAFHRLARERGERFRQDYELWKLTKRNFSPNELLEGKWVKIADHGQRHHFELHRDGTLTERPLFSFDVDDRWIGKWKLIEGVLRLNINVYELDIVASKDGLHSGIEDEGDHRGAYFRVIHSR